MKTSFIKLVLTPVVIVWACNLQAQYILNWSTIDGGGGPCSGGGQAGRPKFTLNGTIGQPDAGQSAVGTYVQQGGFMPAFTLPVTPSLNMTRTGSTLTFTWPASCAGFFLETSPSLNAPVWTSLGNGILVGANRQVTVVSPSSPAFFRLRKDCPK